MITTWTASSIRDLTWSRKRRSRFHPSKKVTDKTPNFQWITRKNLVLEIFGPLNGGPKNCDLPCPKESQSPCLKMLGVVKSPPKRKVFISFPQINHSQVRWAPQQAILRIPRDGIITSSSIFLIFSYIFGTRGFLLPDILATGKMRDPQQKHKLNKSNR